ncbi:MAG: hypothetical protein WAU88_06980 [Candidatus Zixiibacteriota bacterium]
MHSRIIWISTAKGTLIPVVLGLLRIGHCKPILRFLRSIVLLAAVVCGAPRFAAAADASASTWTQFEGEAQIQYMYGTQVQRYGVDLCGHHGLVPAKVSYYVSGFPLCWVKRQGVARFSLALPINALSLGVAILSDKFLFGDRHKDDIGRSPTMLFLLPNSGLRVRLFNQVRATTGLNTDYLFLRVNGAHRGIFLGQYVGLSLTKVAHENQSGWLGVEVRLTHNHFVDFEDPDHEDGWLWSFTFNVGGLGLLGD